MPPLTDEEVIAKLDGILKMIAELKLQVQEIQYDAGLDISE